MQLSLAFGCVFGDRVSSRALLSNSLDACVTLFSRLMVLNALPLYFKRAVPECWLRTTAFLTTSGEATGRCLCD